MFKHDFSYENSFERHSYEADLAALHDHLASTADTSVTAVFVHRLPQRGYSGAQAGQAYDKLTRPALTPCDEGVLPQQGAR